jgi:type II secretory ATPase GspE/PulE/Tfp pilus assembly ATPase PilB-like protein
MEAAPHPWPALGVLLVRDGLVSKEELEVILEEQRDARHKRISGHQLGELLVARGSVTPTQVAKLVAEQYELPFLELQTADIDLSVAHLLGEEIARRLYAVPVSARADGSYLVAIADPATVLFSDELRRVLGSTTHFAVVGPEAIDAAIAFVHDRPDVLPAVVDSPDDEDWHGVVVDLRSEDSTDVTTFDDDPKLETRTATHAGPPLGALLVREGLVTGEELERALTQQSLSTSWRLGEILVDLGVVTSAVVARLIAEQYELPYMELADRYIEPHVAALLPREIAREFPAVPIASHPDGSLEVAIADPTNVYYSSSLQSALGVPLTFVVASPDAIEALLETVHTPAAVVELDAEAEAAEMEPLVTSDQVDFVTVEDAEEVVSEPEALPEFVIEHAAFEEPVRVEEPTSAEEPAAEEETARWHPTWATELEVAEDAVELAEQKDARVEGPEADDAFADELASVLLAEVAEIHEPTDPVVDAEHEVSLALVEVEIESAEELTETEAVAEPADAESAIALVDVDRFADIPESTELPVQSEELDAEDPSAYADDLDAAIEEVLKRGASAIHFSPQGEWHTVRARIDGLVRELGVVAKEDLESLVERIEASTAMRVAVVPTKQGDKVILFPREQAGSPRILAELGLTSAATDAIDSALSLPSGALVVCGPIGSGTTTTLYAALGSLNTTDRVVASIEDPVERVLDGIDQTEVVVASGVTFADGLRTLLATDSDMVLVGEIRDQETADVALQAALDGRHILAGLRAPSAAAAIRRLADMGLEPSVLGGALTCVVAQRLVRRVCTDCRETYYASDSELAELGQPGEGGGPRLLARGRGCGACDGTGFRGRVGLFEILTVTEETRALVCDGASAKKIHRAAVAGGMQTLRDDGIRLCLEGITTAAEVRRILGAERVH